MRQSWLIFSNFAMFFCSFFGNTLLKINMKLSQKNFKFQTVNITSLEKGHYAVIYVYCAYVMLTEKWGERVLSRYSQQRSLFLQTVSCVPSTNILEFSSTIGGSQNRGLFGRKFNTLYS